VAQSPAIGWRRDYRYADCRRPWHRTCWRRWSGGRGAARYL